jgi:hypothetical protein
MCASHRGPVSMHVSKVKSITASLRVFGSDTEAMVAMAVVLQDCCCCCCCLQRYAELYNTGVTYGLAKSALSIEHDVDVGGDLQGSAGQWGLRQGVFNCSNNPGNSD